MAPPIMAARSRRKRRQAWAQWLLGGEDGTRPAMTLAALADSAAIPFSLPQDVCLEQRVDTVQVHRVNQVHLTLVRRALAHQALVHLA
jgi:hypothetical protein